MLETPIAESSAMVVTMVIEMEKKNDGGSLTKMEKKNDEVWCTYYNKPCYTRDKC